MEREGGKKGGGERASKLERERERADNSISLVGFGFLQSFTCGFVFLASCSESPVHVGVRR